ncbi:MAG TPA: DUF1611 domain-containing protein [Steroidobacteraceae bacterium]|nr:DUF1611 domain-containing protein [Steroidobacteraceae bacterium]
MGVSPTSSWSATSPGRRQIVGLETYGLPTLDETIDLSLRLGRRTNPAIRCAGLSFNTARLSESQARRLMTEEAVRLQLPVADPMRGGPEFERLVDSCLREDA